jgi:hypothetical protein
MEKVCIKNRHKPSKFPLHNRILLVFAIEYIRWSTFYQAFQIWKPLEVVVTHRVLFALMDPTVADIVQDRASSKTLHFSHRCGRGRGLLVCVNPYHITLTCCKQNQDHKRCTYGMWLLCPHSPKCIWTWPDSGHIKPCFNTPNPPLECACSRKCIHISSHHNACPATSHL